MSGWHFDSAVKVLAAMQHICVAQTSMYTLYRAHKVLVSSVTPVHQASVFVMLLQEEV